MSDISFYLARILVDPPVVILKNIQTSIFFFDDGLAVLKNLEIFFPSRAVPVRV